MTMPKFPSLKLLRDSIAYRTRLRLGVPITKVEPVQYPSVWPMFRCLTGRNASPASATKSKFRKPNSRWTSPISKSQEKSAEDDCDGMDNQAKTVYRRNVRAKQDNDFLHQMEPSKKARQHLAKKNRRIQKSLIQLVKFKPNRRRQITAAVNSKRGRCIRKRRVRTQRRRLLSRHPRRMSTLSRRQCRTSIAGSRRGRRRRQQTRQVRRRGRRGRIRRRRNSRLVQRKRRRRRKRWDRSDDSRERKKCINPGPSYSQENNSMLTRQDQIIADNLDKGHDEVKDDPLNVKDICRSLVKSLHGIPADCREVNTKETNKKPEMEREERKKEKKKKAPKKRSCKRPRKNSNKNKNSSRSYRRNPRHRRRQDSRRGERSIIHRRRRDEINPTAIGNRQLNKMVKKVNKRGARRQTDHLHHCTGHKPNSRHHHPNHHSHSKVHGKHHRHCHNHHQTSRGGPRHRDTAKQRRRKLAYRSHKSRNNTESSRRGNKNNNRIKQSYTSVWYRVQGRLQRLTSLRRDRTSLRRDRSHRHSACRSPYGTHDKMRSRAACPCRKYQLKL